MSRYTNEKISKSRRLQDLARYSEAFALLQQAESKHYDLNLALEISRLLFLMGLRGQACERIANALDEFSSSEQDEQLVAHSRLIHSLNTITQTARASDSVKTAVQIYNDHLNARPIEDYTPRTKWFDNAGSMARAYSDYYLMEGDYRKLVSADAHKASLHKQLLLESSVPNITRANLLIRYSELLEGEGKTELAQSRIDEAMAIFEQQKHACGGLLIKLEELRVSSTAISPSRRITSIRKIKASFEAVSSWTDATTALWYMYRIAVTELSDTKLAESLYEESLEIPGSSQGSVPWILWQLEVFRTLQWTGARTGRSLASIQALYYSLEESEAPRLREKTAALLSEVYENIGNNTEALKWASRIQHLERYSVFQPEPFSRRLLTLTTCPGLDEEMTQLTRAMQQLAQHTSDNVPFSQRDIAATRMCNIADLYLNQVQLRGIEFTRTLITYCFQQVEPLLPRITINGRLKCTGQILQIKARLLKVETLFAPPILKERLMLLQRALVAHEEALRYYQGVDLPLLAGFASTQLAICHETLWAGTGKSPGARSFYEATRLFEEASTLLRRHGAMDAHRKNAQFQLKVWYAGYRAKLRTPPGIWETFVTWLRLWLGMQVRTPLQKTMEYLEQLERRIDEQRQDLSYLPTEQAIAAKQALRDDEDVRVLYDIAIPFYALQNDMDRVWLTVQKSKARSVSDLLGLGVMLPKDLALALEEDVEAKVMLKRERQILETVERDLTDHQFQLRITLDLCREEMKRNPLLRQMLELREGVPVDVSRLRALSKLLEAQGSNRQIIYVDYFIVSEKIWMLVVLFDSIQAFDLGATVSQIIGWKEKHCQAGEPLNYDDDDENVDALQELTALIEPLGKVSKEGDLIVLCASGPLHAIPLHAVPLNKDPKVHLIDRNPVLYCPSLTVFEQCIVRAHATGTRHDTGGGGGQALLAVYETPAGPGWEVQRDEAYKSFSDLAEEMEDARLFVGAKATGGRFVWECENARIVHFLGHCNRDAGDLMQHLVLAADHQDGDDDQDAANKMDGIFRATLSTPTVPFTISDLFATSIRASHFNLIACTSASQAIGHGDEPWGIVTALLCAGATSASGTMWPIHVGTGQLFMKTLYKGLGGEEGELVDLAVAHQRAVRRLKRLPDTREPYHWAAFVLHGSWFYRC